MTALEQTDASAVLEEAIDDCVEFINDNGRFQIVLWYSGGEINDQSLVRLNTWEDAQVNTGKMNYHVVQILVPAVNVEFKQTGSELMTVKTSKNQKKLSWNNVVVANEYSVDL